ncbi:ATP-grasp domain-containing protein [Arthrobacter sp. Soil762]|uniref:ATP-grasp domain-containing protein n=1 Tax=Arthrobacter sp. Soil762 TaxID=1736401 RepID=UPI0007019913|nr:ATP-grasp domain-containing protein [Arthrobacter sp. Soil762]KRE71148.1 siderophore biosynthesis protein [Arthrobacter sp. Soil762]
MCLYLTALNPTDALTHGFLPAASRLGHDVVVLTDDPDAHRAAYADAPFPAPAVEHADVRDPGAVAATVLGLQERFGRPAGLLSNSDHLQATTSLAAELLGLPAKDWRAALRCKNKFLTRQTLAEAGLDTVASAQLFPGEDIEKAAAHVPFPAVVKPREGVASEDVVLVEDFAALAATVAGIRARRPDTTLVVEEYLAGELHTFETLGDGQSVHVLGSWHTSLGPPPFFTESRRDWEPELPEPVVQNLLDQLSALGVGFGACHTEFVLQGNRARIIEVNYRLIGDTMDLIYSEVLGVDLFEQVIRIHTGEALPEGLPEPAALDRRAHLRYVTADRPGILLDAPGERSEELPHGVRLRHRRLRGLGVTAPLHGTNRDYLAVVHAIGPRSAPVHEAVERFIADNTWEVRA